MSSDSNFYRKKFEQSFLQLNEVQREAVTTIEGPVLTIAGPGTGKTHILSTRIAYILSETDTQAHNILCLTFTDAGVLAMKNRLLDLIGPDAHKIYISTFHSFCNKVLQENLHLFDYKDFRPASDIDIIDIIRSVLDELEPYHPLLVKNRYNPYAYEQKLKDLFAKIKTEAWTVEFINQQIENYIQSLPKKEEYIYKVSRGTFKKGDLKQKDIDAEINKMELLKAAVLLFDSFDNKMKAAGLYDYNDMILWTLRIFEDPEQEHILRNYQEQFLYVLVDEYQDTNGAQNSILMKLIDFWEEPNVFVVGDDDQSIFGFQGARVRNVLDYYNSYKNQGLKLVILGENYRSSQKILDAAKLVIDHNILRIINYIDVFDAGIQLEKKLSASNPQIIHSENRVEINAFPNRQQEEVFLVNKILELSKENIDLNEIAVIYARHKQSTELIRLLEKYKIPYQTKREINILDSVLIKNIIEILEYISKENEISYSAEDLIYRILHIDFLDINPSDIVKVSNYIAKENRKKFKGKERDFLPWRDLISDKTLLENIQIKQIDKFIAFSDLISSSATQQMNQPLAVFLDWFYQKSGLLDYILNLEDKSFILDTIRTFQEFIVKEQEKKFDLNLKSFLALIQKMRDNKLEINLIKTNISDNAVHLLTAHSSKGLEFKYVFLIHCVKDFWEPSSTGLSNKQFSLPENLTVEKEEKEEIENSRRLFYVAMTRAKTHLYLSYFEQDHNLKEIVRTQFIDHFADYLPLEIYRPIISTDLLEDYQLKSNIIVDKTDELKYYKDLIQNFTMSFSAFNSYLECPVDFYYKYVLRIPENESSLDLIFGNTLHQCLKQFFDKAANAEILSADEFLNLIITELERYKAICPKYILEKAVTLANTYVPEYYKQRIESFIFQSQQNIWTEINFSNQVYKNVPLVGNIDKIYIFQDKNGQAYLNLVDYKYGSHKDSKFKRPTKKNKGGTYYRQLAFYKLLTEQANFQNLKVEKAEIDYLYPDEKFLFKKVAIELNEQDVEEIGDLILETYQKIKSMEFDNGCKKAHCKWCNFEKNRSHNNFFEEEEEESLEF